MVCFSFQSYLINRYKCNCLTTVVLRTACLHDLYAYHMIVLAWLGFCCSRVWTCLAYLMCELTELTNSMCALALPISCTSICIWTYTLVWDNMFAWWSMLTGWVSSIMILIYVLPAPCPLFDMNIGAIHLVLALLSAYDVMLSLCDSNGNYFGIHPFIVMIHVCCAFSWFMYVVLYDYGWSI